MAQSKMQMGKIGEAKVVTWELEDWGDDHELIAAAGAEFSCLVEMEDPKASIRFFLKPITKQTNVYLATNGFSVVAKWYSLYVKVLNFNQNAVIRVNAEETERNVSKCGYFLLSNAKGKELEVIEQFIHVSSGHLDQNAVGLNEKMHGPLHEVESAKFTFTVKAYRSDKCGEGASAASGDNGEEELAEISLIHDLKSMFVAEDNFSDLKLETKDNMTLSAHKFQLAARSPILRKMIEQAVEQQQGHFAETLKLEVNAKPMMVILHWMYTGELHENAGKVIEMEELMDMAIKWELTHLLTLLDKKLITICTKENMFRLYQAAQKTAMPTAMEEISAFIRQNV